MNNAFAEAKIEARVPESVFGKKNPNRKRRPGRRIKKWTPQVVENSPPDALSTASEPASPKVEAAATLQPVPQAPVVAKAATAQPKPVMAKLVKKPEPKVVWPPQLNQDHHEVMFAAGTKRKPVPKLKPIYKPAVLPKQETKPAKVPVEAPIEASAEASAKVDELLNDFKGARVLVEVPSNLTPGNGEDGKPCGIGCFVWNGGPMCGYFYGLPSGIEEGERVWATVQAKRVKEGASLRPYFNLKVVLKTGPEPMYELVVHQDAATAKFTERSLYLGYNETQQGAVEIRLRKSKVQPKD